MKAKVIRYLRDHPAAGYTSELLCYKLKAHIVLMPSVDEDGKMEGNTYHFSVCDGRHELVGVKGDVSMRIPWQIESELERFLEDPKAHTEAMLLGLDW